LKARANAARDRPLSEASSATVQRRSASAWIAHNAVAHRASFEARCQRGESVVCANAVRIAQTRATSSSRVEDGLLARRGDGKLACEQLDHLVQRVIGRGRQAERRGQRLEDALSDIAGEVVGAAQGRSRPSRSSDRRRRSLGRGSPRAASRRRRDRGQGGGQRHLGRGRRRPARTRTRPPRHRPRARPHRAARSGSTAVFDALGWPKRRSKGSRFAETNRTCSGSGASRRSQGRRCDERYTAGPPGQTLDGNVESASAIRHSRRSTHTAQAFFRDANRGKHARRPRGALVAEWARSAIRRPRSRGQQSDVRRQESLSS
jgi:hypothetical protein